MIWKQKNAMLVLFVVVCISYFGYGYTNHASRDHMNEFRSEQISGNWIVVKFIGQVNGSAGIAFPDTNRVPPIDIILQRGIFLRDRETREHFANEVRKNGGNCFIVKKEDFRRTKIDNRLFEGF